MIEVRQLPCGVRLVMEKLPDRQSASIGIWIGAGSARETAKNNGVSHFLEHMFFKGTKTRDQLQLAKDTDDLGCDMNAFTGKEATCFHIKALSSVFPKAVDILLDMLCNSLFDAEEMEKERGVILEEFNMVCDTPDDYIMDLLDAKVFWRTPLAKSVLGSRANIRNLQRSDILEYIDTWYTRDNIVVSVVGNFDEERLAQQLEEKLSDFGAGSPSRKAASAARGSRYLSLTKDIIYFNKNSKNLSGFSGVLRPGRRLRCAGRQHELPALSEHTGEKRAGIQRVQRFGELRLRRSVLHLCGHKARHGSKSAAGHRRRAVRSRRRRHQRGTDAGRKAAAEERLYLFAGIHEFPHVPFGQEYAPAGTDLYGRRDHGGDRCGLAGAGERIRKAYRRHPQLQRGSHKPPQPGLGGTMERIAKFERVSEARLTEDSAHLKEAPLPIELPVRATAGSAGYDFKTPWDIHLQPGESVRIPTGLRCRIAPGWVLLIAPKSGLGFKYRLQLDNTLGVIDEDYYGADNEGHIQIQITNDSRSGRVWEIPAGKAFAQGLFVPYGITEDDEAEGKRTGGFGSTNA